MRWPMEDAESSRDVAYALCHRALRLNLRLEGIVRANLGELDRVGWLRRRSARRHFAVGTGQPAEAWLAEAAEMARRLDRVLASNGAANGQLHPSALLAYAARLRRLAAFNEAQEIEARRRYLDADTLDRVLEALQERRQTTLELAETTEALASELQAPLAAGTERSRR